MNFWKKSLRARLIVLLCIVTIIPVLLSSVISYWYTSHTMRQRFINQTIGSMKNVGTNMSTYMDAINFAARSIYWNSQMVSLLYKRQLNSGEDQALLYFLTSVLSTARNATQVHLVLYDSQRSFLVNRMEQISSPAHYQPQIPALLEPYMAYVELPHSSHTYGINARDMEGTTSVMTLHWPIYHAPSNTVLLGQISIDVPVSALMELCAPLLTQREEIFLVDSTGALIFSSSPTHEDEKGNWIQDTLAATHQEGYFPLKTDDFQGICFTYPLTTKYMDWNLIVRVPNSYLHSDAAILLGINLLMFGLCGIIATVLMILVIYHSTVPLRKLTQYIHAVDEGKLDAKIKEYVIYTNPDEIGILIASVDDMMHSIKSMFLNQYKIELEGKNNELKMLQAQIHPHFLYNTLQCIGASALESNAPNVYDEISMLGQMMQYAMDTKTSFVPLSRELQHSKAYLQLQKLRFAERFNFFFSIDPDAMDIEVPKMILQPLVENCFKHGRVADQQNGTIEISVHLSQNILKIVVDDNGTGIAPQRLEEVRHQLRIQSKLSYFGSSIGLSNVLNRLLLCYNTNCGNALDIEPSPLGGTRITLTIAYTQRKGGELI